MFVVHRRQQSLLWARRPLRELTRLRARCGKRVLRCGSCAVGRDTDRATPSSGCIPGFLRRSLWATFFRPPQARVELLARRECPSGRQDVSGGVFALLARFTWIGLAPSEKRIGSSRPQRHDRFNFGQLRRFVGCQR